MGIETTTNPFGLLGDMNTVATRIAKNVAIASANLHNLSQAAEQGTLGTIQPDELKRILGETLQAVKAIA